MALIDIANAKPTCFNYPSIIYRGNRRILLSEIPGQPMDTLAISNTLVVKLAKTLREFHALPAYYTRKRNDVELIGQYRTNIMDTDHMSSGDKDVALETAVQLAAFYSANHSSGSLLIHGDCNASNILYDVETQAFGFIDYERTHIGIPETDLARIAWRILKNNDEASQLLLSEYWRREPNSDDHHRLEMSKLNEYLGAVAYYAWDGWRTAYPYYNESIEYLRRACRH